MQTRHVKRRRVLLENNRALLDREWLPPGKEWPELAELRAEHERLLAAVGKAKGDATKINEGFRAEDEAWQSELKAAVQEDRKSKEPKLTPDEQRNEAYKRNAGRIDAAMDALVEFLEGAMREIAQRAPELYAGLDNMSAEADEKRQEAARLLAEAEQQVAAVQRRRFWLDRGSVDDEGSRRSALGYYPYGQMPVPQPPAPVNLASVLAGGAVTTLEHA